MSAGQSASSRALQVFTSNSSNQDNVREGLHWLLVVQADQGGGFGAMHVAGQEVADRTGPADFQGGNLVPSIHHHQQQQQQPCKRACGFGATMRVLLQARVRRSFTEIQGASQSYIISIGSPCCHFTVSICFCLGCHWPHPAKVKGSWAQRKQPALLLCTRCHASPCRSCTYPWSLLGSSSSCCCCCSGGRRGSHEVVKGEGLRHVGQRARGQRRVPGVSLAQNSMKLHHAWSKEKRLGMQSKCIPAAVPPDIAIRCMRKHTVYHPHLCAQLVLEQNLQGARRKQQSRGAGAAAG